MPQQKYLGHWFIGFKPSANGLRRIFEHPPASAIQPARPHTSAESNARTDTSPHAATRTGDLLDWWLSIGLGLWRMGRAAQ